MQDTAPRIPESRRGECSVCLRPMWKSRTSAEVQVCLPCRRGRLGPKAHGASGYCYGCRCDVCRSAAVARVREYARRRASEGRPLNAQRARIPATCMACGCDYEARADSVKAGIAKYCSTRCRNLANLGIDPNAPSRPRKPRPRKSKVRIRAEKRAAKAAAGSSGGARVWVQGACAVCEVQFAPSPGLASRYCSAECRAEARSSAKWIDYSVRLRIYRAAGWVCAICGQETARKHSANDPLSPTLDHIVPRSRGGSDDPSNLRLACAACNSLRGDLTYFTDEAVRAARREVAA